MRPLFSESFKKGLGYICLPTLLALFFYWEGLGAYFNGIDLWDIRFTLDDYYSKFFPIWRPFRYTLLYLVYLGFGLDPLPYRILFLIPYICLLVLLYLFYNCITKNKILSIVAVVLFASFYLTAEVVINLIFHHELLMTTLMVAALVCFCLYRENHIKKYYTLSILFAVLAGLSKETAAILPLFFLAVDYHVSCGIFPPKHVPFKTIGRYLLPHLPLWFVALAIAWFGMSHGIVGSFFYIIPGHDAGTDPYKYMNNAYWYIIYTLSPCFITDKLTIMLAFSILAGLGWLFYRSTPERRSLIIAIVVCWGGSLIPYIPFGAVVTKYMFLSPVFTMFLVALLAFEIGLFLHRPLEKRLQGYRLSPDLTTASLALLLLLPVIYLNHGYIKQFCQDVVYAGKLTKEVAEGTLRILPEGPGKHEIIYINVPGSVLSRRPHCVTQSQEVFYQAALDLHYRQKGIKLTNEKISNIRTLFLDLGYSRVKLALDAWYNLIAWDAKPVAAEEYDNLSKDAGNKLLYFNPVNSKLVDVSGWSYEHLKGSITPYRDKLNYDPPNFLP